MHFPSEKVGPPPPPPENVGPPLDPWKSKVFFVVVVLCLTSQGHGLKSGEAGNRTCDPWFTRQVVYPLHHSGSLVFFVIKKLLDPL